MHKSYYTVKPCQNKLLQAKWDQKNYEAHRKKLQEIYPVIDTRAPRTYMHMHLKLKKIRLEEEKLYLIERDNRILLEKMSNIMRTGGRIDNKNNYEPKSLSRSRKQRELLRIARENQDIMQRIIEQRPQYSVEKWDRDWIQNLDYIESISQYPDNWWIKSYHPTRSQSMPANQSNEETSSNNENSSNSKRNKSKKEKEKPENNKEKNEKESENEENDDSATKKKNKKKSVVKEENEEEKESPESA